MTKRTLPQSRIIVIGAGISGLRAAECLLEHSCNVTILEARDRIGGRIQTSPHLGIPVDLGAGWKHGGTEECPNPLNSVFAKTQSCLHDPYDFPGMMISAEGDEIPECEAEDIRNWLEDLMEAAVSISNEDVIRNELDASWSFWEFAVERLDKSLAGRTDEAHQRIREGVELLSFMTGSDVRKQSMKEMKLEEEYPGGDWMLASTYGLLVQELAARVSPKVDLCLGAQVTSIMANEDGVKVFFAAGGSDPIEFRDAEAVVLAVPLGCLKQNHIMITPPFPSEIQRGIRELGYGTLEKVFIRFPSAFWVPGPAYMQFLSPNYAQDTNPNRWPMSCFSLAHFPQPYSSPVILFELFGDLSRHVTTIAISQEAIFDFFKPYFSRLPGYDAGSPSCQPVQFLCSNWMGDKYAGNGSYTNFQVGISNGSDHVAALRAGWPEKRVWIAGEHCGEILGLGSVTGAWWGGENAAKLCAKHLGL